MTYAPDERTVCHKISCGAPTSFFSVFAFKSICHLCRLWVWYGWFGVFFVLGVGFFLSFCLAFLMGYDNILLYLLGLEYFSNFLVDLTMWCHKLLAGSSVFILNMFLAPVIHAANGDVWTALCREVFIAPSSALCLALAITVHLFCGYHTTEGARWNEISVV